MYDVFTNDADSLLQKFFRRIFIGLKVMHVLLFMFSFYNTRTHILVYYFHSNTLCVTVIILAIEILFLLTFEGVLKKDFWGGRRGNQPLGSSNYLPDVKIVDVEF